MRADAIEFLQHLVQRLGSERVRRSAVAARGDRIYFVEKQYAGRVSPRLLEQLLYSRSALTNKRSFQISRARRNKVHPRFIRQRSCALGLSRSRRTSEEDRCRDLKRRTCNLSAMLQRECNILQGFFHVGWNDQSTPICPRVHLRVLRCSEATYQCDQFRKRSYTTNVLATKLHRDRIQIPPGKPNGFAPQPRLFRTGKIRQQFITR